ncbi:MAG: AEC family transporter [Chloroflexi bacterium]|nr:AEC family transporter [Chloroflexota bacterium]
MNVFDIVFQSVVALLGIGVLGFWIIKRRIIPESLLGVLSVLAIDIALPSIVFANILLYFSPSKVPLWWQLPLWWLLFSSVSLCLTGITMFLSAAKTRSEFAVSLFFQNAIFFPLIILTGVFGRETPHAAHLFVFVVLHPTLYFSAFHLFFGRRAGAKHNPINLRRVLNPVLLATLLALSIRILGTDVFLPPFIITIFQLLGGMTLPLLMLILGGSLYIDFQKRGPIYFTEVLKFVFVKNILFPLAFLALLLAIRPEYNIAFLIMLQSVVPPITGIPIMTEREGGNVGITNQFILGSFLFSIVSIPAMLSLFSRFFPLP